MQGNLASSSARGSGSRRDIAHPFLGAPPGRDMGAGQASWGVEAQWDGLGTSGSIGSGIHTNGTNNKKTKNLHTALTDPQMMQSLLHSTLPFHTWTKGTPM